MGIDSTSDDYTSTGTTCGEVDDHLGQPDVTICNGAVGQYVTVELQSMVITICELIVMGSPGSGSGGAGVVQVGTSDAGTTVQLVTTLDATTQANAYAFAGTTDTALTMPAAYQAAAPFGADVGGVNPAFFPINAAAEFDSWLSVGPTDGSAGAAISAIGVDFAAWTASAGLTTDNGAIFWMNPADGPS